MATKTTSPRATKTAQVARGTKSTARPATKESTSRATKIKATGAKGLRDETLKQKKKNSSKASQSSATRTTSKVKPQRTDLDLEHFRELLLSERVRLEAERDQIRNRGLDMDGALPEEGEGGDEDTADLASAMMDKEYDLSVEDEIEEMLQSVDHALRKIEDGSYGICDMSGEPIPASRLELIPWASLTVECQALSEGE